MSEQTELRVPVRVFNEATADDLGIVHVPLPVELGDQLVIKGHASPLEVVDLIESSADAAVAALVTVRQVVQDSV